MSTQSPPCKRTRIESNNDNKRSSRSSSRLIDEDVKSIEDDSEISQLHSAIDRLRSENIAYKHNIETVILDNAHVKMELQAFKEAFSKKQAEYIEQNVAMKLDICHYQVIITHLQHEVDSLKKKLNMEISDHYHELEECRSSDLSKHERTVLEKELNELKSELLQMKERLIEADANTAKLISENI